MTIVLPKSPVSPQQYPTPLTRRGVTLGIVWLQPIGTVTPGSHVTYLMTSARKESIVREVGIIFLPRDNALAAAES